MITSQVISGEEEARAYVAGLTDDEGLARLERFAALVLEENQRQNLIAKATEPHLWQRHIADSIAHIELLAVESIRNAALSIDQRQPVDAVLEQLEVDVEALRLAREELKAW